MKLRCLLGAAAALLLTVMLRADPATFEGTVQMKVSGGSRLVRTMTFQTRADQARIVTVGDAGKTAVLIMNYKNATMTILMPAQHMYMTRPLTMPSTSTALTDHPGALTGADPAHAAPALVKEGATDTILGYTCDKYVTRSDNATTVIWATDQLGSFSALGRGNFGAARPGRAAVPQGWEKALAGKNFFPLRVVSTDANGTEKFRMEVTGVTREKLPDSDFVPPAGFQELDMSRLLGQH